MYPNIEKSIVDYYAELDNPEDQEMFFDYLIANLKLYFDKWEGFDSDIKNETYQHVLKSDISIRAYFLPIPEVSDNIKLFIPKEIDPNPVFIIENGGSSAYLTSKTE